LPITDVCDWNKGVSGELVAVAEQASMPASKSRCGTFGAFGNVPAFATDPLRSGNAVCDCVDPHTDKPHVAA
jgi:hypothetical protein